MAKAAAAPLQHISPDRIKPNPDNPRLVFREEQMNELLESIREGGSAFQFQSTPTGLDSR